jgi:hypothetical protein
MADYADVSEVDDIDKIYAGYPDVGEIIKLCMLLDIEKENFLLMEKDDAWAYYHKLKARVEAMERKSA